ncbi:ABC transporter ATP-binding protein, partial [archaeon SCG-AAA382B04]
PTPYPNLSIKILLDFISPSDGRAEVLGLDAQERSLEIRERVGYLPEVSNVYDKLTGKRHVEFAKDVKNADTDVDEVLRRVGLEDEGDRRAGSYSKGMKQRLGIAMALVGEPDLFILDEPTTGLDPNGARMVREIVRKENKRGATVFFSSHILEQAEKVSDRVGILKGGELVAEDTIEGLRERVEATSVLRLKVDEVPDLKELKEINGVKKVKTTGDVIEIEIGKNVTKGTLVDAIKNKGVQIIDISTEESSLEDLFAILTGGGE